MIYPKNDTLQGDIIKCSIRTHRVPVCVFAHYVEQIAYRSDHDARLSTVSDHRVCFSATRRPVREHCGVKTDEYVFHQAFRRLFVHFVLNKLKKKKNTSFDDVHRRFSESASDLYYVLICTL